MGRPYELEELFLLDIGDVARCIAGLRCGAGAPITTVTTAAMATATPVITTTMVITVATVTATIMAASRRGW